MIQKYKNKIIEASINHFRGAYGTHYFGNLYYLEGPNSGFPWKIVNDGYKPALIEIKSEGKYWTKEYNELFQSEGELEYVPIRFSIYSIIIDDIEFQKSEIESNINDLLALFF